MAEQRPAFHASTSSAVSACGSSQNATLKKVLAEQISSKCRECVDDFALDIAA
ncbi:MAG: hypothetical protein WCT12_00780 [Verrucomicrobiota bacterium]